MPSSHNDIDRVAALVKNAVLRQADVEAEVTIEPRPVPPGFPGGSAYDITITSTEPRLYLHGTFSQYRFNLALSRGGHIVPQVSLFVERLREVEEEEPGWVWTATAATRTHGGEAMFIQLVLKSMLGNSGLVSDDREPEVRIDKDLVTHAHRIHVRACIKGEDAEYAELLDLGWVAREKSPGGMHDALWVFCERAHHSFKRLADTKPEDRPIDREKQRKEWAWT